jgi:lysine 2,3-aminomutase
MTTKISHQEVNSSDDEPPPWKKILRNSISSAREITSHFNLSEEEAKGLEAVCRIYPAKINSYYLSLIKEKGDPIYRQCIPSVDEITDTFGEEDPLHEESSCQSRENVPSLITHRYPDRVLFQVSNQCSMYCRFCTRKRKMGDPTKQPRKEEMRKGLEYIRNHPEIRDVILSGGDPLLFDDSVLEEIVRGNHNILKERKGILRIGTRIPCALPQRVTPELCEMLKKYQPLYINTHFNHPAEITPESEKACNMLADAGIPLGCQTVLLKGVNDNPETMKALMTGLVHMRVRPYYLYQADPVKGTNHFRTVAEDGQEIYRALRGHISGLAVPLFVIDAPGGGGKVPALPSYIRAMNDGEVLLDNYENKKYSYPQVKKR